MKKIYIAGKVTGESQEKCEAKFAEAQKTLEGRGFEAINPIQEVGDWNAPWDTAMKICIAKLLEADAIILLNDWQHSKGAKVEKQLAKNLKIPTFSFTQMGIQSMINQVQFAKKKQ